MRFKKQEERLERRSSEDGQRIRQPEEMNASLRSSAKCARETRDRAIEARGLIQADMDALTADMQDLNAQVGPAVELAEERQHHEQTV